MKTEKYSIMVQTNSSLAGLEGDIIKFVKGYYSYSCYPPTLADEIVKLDLEETLLIQEVCRDFEPEINPITIMGNTLEIPLGRLIDESVFDLIKNRVNRYFETLNKYSTAIYGVEHKVEDIYLVKITTLYEKV